jgi:hypothetical protein
MRKLLLLCAGMTASVAFGQAPGDPNEVLIWNAYGKLAAESNFMLNMVGTNTVAGVTKTFNSVLYFNLSTDPRTNLQSLAKVELDTYDTSGKTPVLLRRAVGNGGNLWVYDLVNERYFSSFYSFYGSQRPASYPPSDSPKMLEQLQASVEGPSAYLVRLLREVNQGGPIPTTPTYHSWAPGEVTMQPLTAPPTQDPLVPSRVYASSSGEQWVLYGPAPLDAPKYYTYPPSRSVAFQIDNATGDASSQDWRLTNIYFAERTKNTFSNWTIQIDDPTITTPTWAFQPYSMSALEGWRPLDTTRHYTGAIQ